jgi:hypothetical protein
MFLPLGYEANRSAFARDNKANKFYSKFKLLFYSTLMQFCSTFQQFGVLLQRINYHTYPLLYAL